MMCTSDDPTGEPANPLQHHDHYCAHAHGSDSIARSLEDLGRKARAGTASKEELAAVAEIGDLLNIDLAAAAAWSPALIRRALDLQPATDTVAAALRRIEASPDRR